MALGKRSRRILEQIAKGHSYEQILAADPSLTYPDIFAAAREALGGEDATPPAPVRPAAPQAGLAKAAMCTRCGVLIPGSRLRAAHGAGLCEDCAKEGA